MSKSIRSGQDSGFQNSASSSLSNLTLGDGETVPVEEPDPYRYRMDHPSRGLFFIINNKVFDASTKLPTRDGTDMDAANLQKLFTKLGFTVTLYNNQKSHEMLKIMLYAKDQDHSKYDCFGFAVLSHGKDGQIYGTDAIMSIEALTAPIKDCCTLSGKPKIFFFQACRGTKTDAGRMVSDDGSQSEHEVIRIPREADFLYAYSTSPGYVSWPSRKGCWYVQALCKVFSDAELRKTHDLVKLLTRVNHCVAYDFESQSVAAKYNGKKQAPSFLSLLTKDFYFPPDPSD